jgi:hypothetical protein
MSNRPVYVVAFVLALIGLAVFGYKLLVLKVPLAPDVAVKVWDVEVQVRFRGDGGAASMTLHLPHPGDAFRIIDERFVSGDFGVSVRRSGENRVAVWTAREVRNEQRLYYRATIRENPRVIRRRASEPGLVDPGFQDAMLGAATQLLRSIRERKGRVDAAAMAGELLRRLAAPVPDDATNILLAGRRGDLHVCNTAVRLLALARIPARTTHGIHLQTLARDTDVRHWLEVYYDNRWHAFDPATGSPLTASRQLPWWRGPEKLAYVKGGEQLHTRVGVSLNPQAAIHQPVSDEQIPRSTPLVLSLLALPIDTQAVYHVLLTVPIGVLVLVLMRNVVGVSTFGTFMPVLIALAFRETQLLAGIALFIIIVGAGLGVRFYLDRLHLLVVPRLAAVLIVVILLVLVLTVASYQAGISRGISVALFPMVILTMTIERMSVVWDERGPVEALKQGGGSLVVASLAYLTMNMERLAHTVFLFPEFLLVLLAAILLLGRYTGYRLTELVRFGAFRPER